MKSLKTITTMDKLDLKNQKVLIRSDLNVPIQDGKITSNARIIASLPTIQKAINMGGKIIIMSHLGRPNEGTYQSSLSLKPVAKELELLLNKPVTLVKNWLTETFTASQKTITLLENVRFNIGEYANDPTLSKKMAQLCDVFIMDAFGTAHRAQASTHGVASFAKIASAGQLLIEELTALNQALENPQPPMIAIIGGSKVSTKASLIESLSKKCNLIIPGGGIANTLLAATNNPVGKSLIEKDCLPLAKKLLTTNKIILPVDVVVANNLNKNAIGTIKLIADIKKEDMILDIGPQTSEKITQNILQAKTILWNGPLGVFEYDQFGEGTQKLAQAIAKSSAFSIAGGGDTLFAIEKYQQKNAISYISTGGGAFLEYMEGKTLPGVEVLLL